MPVESERKFLVTGEACRLGEPSPVRLRRAGPEHRATASRP
jgi:hypothetical protein